jgi:hypothetical protein
MVRLRATAAVLVIAATVCAAMSMAQASVAAERATLQTSFSPDRLGASTTIGFGFQISSTDGGAPAPLDAIDLHLPKGINYLSTTLGLAICQPAALAARGLAGCSPNSRLGFGSAYVEVPFGQSSAYEIPNIQALMGPPHDGNVVVLFYADGREPVSAQLVFTGELIEGSNSTGGSLTAAVPLIPSITAGPPVSIVSVHTTIGPQHLTYYRHIHGRTVSFHPLGVSLPLHCPRGGFPFSATFGFTDGSSASATSAVPCPRSR